MPDAKYELSRVSAGNRYLSFERRFSKKKLAELHEIFDAAAGLDPQPALTDLRKFILKKLGVDVDERQIKKQIQKAHARTRDQVSD